ncbi:TIGR00730 family Rossman fold protein [Bacillus cereus group sp. BceL296]|uniref:LOG family protein n=1 Tax=Bacillus cereus group TaxID=86661 RepID=UPI00065BB6C9|nr:MULTISPECIES: TIGR00730 family Rossman fold protein [Bacillus cereus group]KMQ13425.1 LOG family protein [Bacillus cereus]MCU5391739.1 TIGR00730 family Rossman fold protein [Bacillus paranthracis]MDA1624152.1 TIGR00730 family Rossman fold protein [Bacillus cereus group sp. TH206-1LC]MDA1751269.1 TIGR00730 family Rossman fold protein [Bacillus cereus group sp. LD113LC]MDA1823430.1 TIGR00730 family Rossman fold protein [Bacillus cereus group sp. BY2-1LC]
MNSICVFCGSNFGESEEYKNTAEKLGEFLGKKNTTLIYGGGKVGLMGSVANSALQAGGNVVGIIPEFLRDKEIAHQGLTDLIVVDSMHSRKQKMSELADGFIVLPGGYGTYEEMFEVLSWGQIGIHKKPVGLINVDGFFDPLLKMLQHTVDKGFARPENLNLILSSTNIEELFAQMKDYNHVIVNKWVDKKA